ncbi:cytochrome P450 [Actinomadura sp. J1-007]|uniref:cytochrome P450 n=1 Tax=Actinomadura sp. J1-007 TaxID=2661913 RepID=UPI002816827D|nr:cytochrome P450 [Actinomadura sp. J1-007]
MAEFRLPDLSLPFPAPRPRGDAGELRDGLCRWAEEQGLIGPRGRTRLMTSRLLDLGLGLACGARAERAPVLLGWFLWMLLLDDRVDDGPWADGGVIAGFAASASAIVLPGPRRDRRLPQEDPMLRTLAEDLWPRTAELADERWQARFARSLARHLSALCALVDLRDGRELDVPEYVALRRDLFGADVFFDLFEAVDGLALADEDRPPALRDAAADVIAWTNDVYSVEKDLAFRERANLVLLLQRERSGTWQDAIDTAHEMVERRFRDFQQARAALPSWDAMVFADRLQAAMRSSLDWHRSVRRYNFQHAAGPGAGGGAVDTRRTPPSLLWPEFERDPYPLYRRLREEFPVVRDEPLDAWLVSRYADVRIALTDSRFTSRNYGWQLAPMFGRTVLQMDGREHAAHRAFLTPAFRGRALARLTESIERSAAALAAPLRDRDEADLVAGFCNRFPISVVVTALGLPAEDAPLFQDWYRAGFSYLGNYRQDPATLARGLSSRDELYAYLAPFVRERRARPADDLLSVLCEAEVDGAPLPDEMIMGFCGTLLGAGGETTDKSLSSLLRSLLDDPELLAAVRDEPGLATRAWAESLRRDPPVQVVLRQTAGTAELPSGRIPAGATVACLVGAANRDPERFSDPDRFDPFRTDGAVEREFTGAATHLAFGAGRHFCLGARLAQAEVEIGVRVLLETLPTLRWAPDFAPPKRASSPGRPRGCWSPRPEGPLAAAARPAAARRSVGTTLRAWTKRSRATLRPWLLRRRRPPWRTVPRPRARDGAA